MVNTKLLCLLYYLVAVFVMFINICCLPWITNPNISNRSCGEVAILVKHFLRKRCLLFFNLILNTGNESDGIDRVARHTCKTNTEKTVFFPFPPSVCRATSMSFSSSLTAYPSVVRVSSISSTIKICLPTRFCISPRLLKSSHCVRVTLVPGCSISLDDLELGPSSEDCKSSYSESPIAWIGIFGEPGCLRNDLRIRAGT